MVRRARPMLGTFVEISLRGGAASVADAGFDAIARVDRLMSAHRPDSDLARLNAAAPSAWVTVDPLTIRVLRAALRLNAASDGAFDIRCGADLARSGHLPAPAGTSRPPAADERGAAVELRGRRARKTGPWHLDLGGIAKGFAVDLAVTAMRSAGASGGVVNAGGDLRVFGDAAWPVALRHPSRPSHSIPLGPVRRTAVATSCVRFSRRRAGRRWTSAIVRPGGRPFLARRSVTVLSPTAMMADALTKVVALRPDLAAGLLPRFRARALVASPDGRVRALS